MSKIQIAAAVAATLILRGEVVADPIIAPVNVTASSVFDQGPATRLGDQSGLSASYLSGLTDFDAFLTSATHANNAPSNSWSSITDTNEYTDFDFGGPITLTRLALFGDDSPNGNNIMDFTVLIGDDPSFAVAMNLGSFTATDSNSNPITPQIFDVADGAGQYVRIQLDANYGGAFGYDVFIYGEAVFEGSPVPEPGTILLAIVALPVLGFQRRRLV